MSASLPTVFIPGLLCSARLYEDQIAATWRFGPVTVADHTRESDIVATARSILATAPARFALIGLSMGGYVSMEIMRQAPQRVAKLALLDTNPHPDTPEQTAARRELVALARSGRFAEVIDRQFPTFVAPRHHNDPELLRLVRVMADETGADGFERQENTIISRPDSVPSLSTIRCPTLVLVGDEDALTPPERAREIAAGIRGSRLVIVPRCGHLSTLERPAEVSRALTELLQS
jgi:pimeloyl-ACP methyl ester carboxylesterase